MLLISILHSIFYWCFSHVLASFGKFIFAAYCSVIEFVIVWTCFSHQSGIRALWLRGCFFTCLNDGGTYEDGILEWSKLSLLEGQDEELAICEEYASSGLWYTKTRFYVW